MLIKNISIYQKNTGWIDGYLTVKNGKIQEIHTGEAPGSTDLVIDGKGLRAIPGFIDGHIHGAAGADLMDAEASALDKMASWLPKEGTTSFLATTITQSEENIETALKTAAAYENKAGHAELLGVHLEGPYVNAEKAGAQPKEHIIQPNETQFNHWQKLAGNKIKVVTYAPEQDADGVFLKELTEQDVIASAGHTAAGFDAIREASEQGLKQLTHLCNQMNGIHHRDIGAVGAGFLLDELLCEVIADGVHVSEEMLKLVFRNIGSERLLLITDSLRAKGLADGSYDLGGQMVTVKDGRAVLPDGTLAGSVLKMDQAVRNMQRIAGATIEEIVQMTAENQAQQYGYSDRKGSLEPGKDADILLVNDQLELMYTICRGEIAYQKGMEQSC